MIGLYAAVLAATLIGAILSAGLFIYAWQRRRAPAAATFGALAATISLTSLCYVVMWSTPSVDVTYLFARLRFIGLALMAVFYLIFVLEYIGMRPLRLRWRALLLFAVPLVTQLFLWTNESHSLFFRAWDVVRVGPFASESIIYGPAWQLHALYSYGCMVAGIALLLRTALRSTGIYAVQAILMFFGSLVVVIVNIPVAFLLADKPIPNLTPVSYAVASAIFAFALQRHRLLDLIPVALDVVYNSMDDAVLLMDMQERMVAANPAALRILNQQAGDVIGQTITDAFKHQPALLKEMNALDEPEGQVSDGADPRRYYDLRRSAVTRSGEHTGTVLVLRDVTERRLAEKRTMELTIDQEKIRLLAGFIRDTSHDLKTPLTVMNTALYLARKTDDPAKRDAKLSEIEQQIGQIQRIVDGLLLLTSLDTATTMEISMFRLSALIEPLPADIRSMIERKAQTLTVDIRDDSARGDVTLLRRAVHNLVQNAALYTPPQGEITIRARREDDEIVIEVEDTGVGIAPKDLAGIFDRFTKVNRARTQDGSGAGLGLAIVRKIAQLHSGHITANSAPDKGSIFRLTVPASQRPTNGIRPMLAAIGKTPIPKS